MLCAQSANTRCCAAPAGFLDGANPVVDMYELKVGGEWLWGGWVG